MKKFIALLIVFAIIGIGKPLLSYSQAQDTSKPATQTQDTSKPLAPIIDTSKSATQLSATPIPSSQVKENTEGNDGHKKHKKKKHWSLLYRIHMIGYKKRERRRYVESGHHEFYLRSKKEQKRISQHHLNPFKPSKPDKVKEKHKKHKSKKASKQSNEDNAQPKAEEQPKADNDKSSPENGKQNDDIVKPKDGSDRPKTDTVK